jgi:uncharacterized membrane protein YeaQ/YmgE (transglycosylase-associated protein family)
MNVALWIVAGGVLGWFGQAYLKKNAARGLIVAVIIGAVGAFFGGQVLAPIFGSAADPGAFMPFALVVACASAIGCLIVSDMMYERFGV